MASTGGTPFLLSPATGYAATPPPSSAVLDVEAAGALHRATKSTPAPDAGAAFVLESKGTWWHAGFHLTTAIVGPTVLTLPYALRGMGWGLGLAALTAVFAVTFYAYYLVSRVLDHCEAAGRRHIRFRELAAAVLGSGCTGGDSGLHRRRATQSHGAPPLRGSTCPPGFLPLPASPLRLRPGAASSGRPLRLRPGSRRPASPLASPAPSNLFPAAVRPAPARRPAASCGLADLLQPSQLDL